MSENHAAHLARINESLTNVRAALDRIERSLSDPEEVRQALSDIAGIQRGQILEIVEWMRDRISGAEQKEQKEQTGNLAFVVGQIGPILQGTRDDIVLMRKDLRELRAAIELAVGQLPTQPTAPPPETATGLADNGAQPKARRGARQK